MKVISRLRCLLGIPIVFLCGSIAASLILLATIKSGGKLSQQIRILCLVVSHPGQHNTQANATHHTWARRCTNTLFVSNSEPKITDFSYLDDVCSVMAATAVLGEELQQFEHEFCSNGTGNVEVLQDPSSNSTIPKRLPDMGNYSEWVEWFSPTFPMITVPETRVGRQGLWNKTKFAFQHAYDSFLNDFDWFLKADDDTYFIIENLRDLLRTQDPNDNIYFGCNLRTPDSTGYMSGGAGYVLSRAALQQLGPALHNSQSWLTDTDPEDVNIGAVLRAAGAQPGDSRDTEGRPRFFPLSARWLADPRQDGQPDWYWLLTGYAHNTSPQCCSPRAISFHYMTASDMYFTELLLYNIDRQHF
ncbi:Fringe-like [Trinorchestia longiramus]|nr:Fringe-like [Trinorchestia longiramus]